MLFWPLALTLVLALLYNTANGQVESPSFPSDAPTAHPLNSSGVDAPSSIESALLGTKPQEKRTLINLDEFNLAEFEDAVESSKPGKFCVF